MSTSDTVFSGSIPETYDRHMVPLIFQHYAEDLAERAARSTPEGVLEIAAGTGVVTRVLAPKLAARSKYVVTDLNQPMVDYAQALQGDDPRITWAQADALGMPYSDDEFDVVCCQFGVMFFPDRVAGYSEAKRVLKSGGRFVFNVWDRVEDNVLTHDVTKALAELYPDDPPTFMVRTPYGYHDPAAIRRDVEAAGYSSISIETKEGISRAPTAMSVAMGLCQGTPMRSEIEARDPDGLKAATEFVASWLTRKHGDGALEGTIKAHVIEATA